VADLALLRAHLGCEWARYVAVKRSAPATTAPPPETSAGLPRFVRDAEGRFSLRVPSVDEWIRAGAPGRPCRGRHASAYVAKAISGMEREACR
jgi:hypothetical protein